MCLAIIRQPTGLFSKQKREQSMVSSAPWKTLTALPYEGGIWGGIRIGPGACATRSLSAPAGWVLICRTPKVAGQGGHCRIPKFPVSDPKVSTPGPRTVRSRNPKRSGGSCTAGRSCSADRDGGEVGRALFRDGDLLVAAADPDVGRPVPVEDLRHEPRHIDPPSPGFEVQPAENAVGDLQVAAFPFLGDGRAATSRGPGPGLAGIPLPPSAFRRRGGWEAGPRPGRRGTPLPRISTSGRLEVSGDGKAGVPAGPACWGIGRTSA